MLFPHRTDSGLTIYLSPLLQRIGVPHAFSTRLGGVSRKPFDSLNLGLLGDSELQDDLANIQENYRRLRAAIGCEERERCWVHQVHGNNVCIVLPDKTFECGQKADALVSDDPRRLVSVKYADCVPVLMSTADGRAVAAVHSGWRGVVAGVIPAAVKKLTEMAGALSATLSTAIGPCIGFAHFEVGPEVLAAFVERFGRDAPIRMTNCGAGFQPATLVEAGSPHHNSEKGFIDLQQAVRLQLLEAGLPADRIDANDRCTFRDRDEFFSHRRDAGVTGRMAAIIGTRKIA